MISLKSRFFNFLFKLLNKKNLLRKQFKYNRFDLFSSSEPGRSVRAYCWIEKYFLQGQKVFTLKPKKEGEGTHRHILYIHGGAYVQNFTRPHWEFLTYLVKETHCTITAPDYPLAPDHTYVQAFAMLTKLYKRLLHTVKPVDIVFMGDSAGGGMALALAQLMKNEQLPQPSQIILLSPWLDLSLSNPEIKEIDPSDYFLGVEGLQLAGKAYAGGTDTRFYLLSPIYGSIEGLGKISVFAGSREILVADARKLKKKADEKGIPLNYQEYAGMFHVWMLLNLPESKQVKKQIVELLVKA